MVVARALLLAVLLAGLPGSVPAAAPGGDVEAILAQLKANLEPLQDLSADVTVETEVKQVWTKEIYRQRYRYRFARPSLIRMDYDSPAGRLVIARGRSVWSWENGELKEEGKRTEEEESLFSLWGLSLDPEGLRREFTFSAFAEPERPRLAGLLLVPKGAAMSVTTIRVWIDRRRGVVDQVKVFGAKERLLSTSAVGRIERFSGVWLPVQVVTYGCEGRCTTTITYEGVAVNQGLAAELFDPSSVKPPR